MDINDVVRERIEQARRPTTGWEAKAAAQAAGDANWEDAGSAA